MQATYASVTSGAIAYNATAPDVQAARYSTATNTFGLSATAPTLFSDGAYRCAATIKELIILNRASDTLDGDRAKIRDYAANLIL